MDKFDPGTKFVIACGHLGQQLKDYFTHVHADKNIVFVDIPDYSEGNTGPATTIQHCAQHLKDGFLWLACDTLFEFDYRQRLDHNWIGVYPVDSAIAQDYCWVERDGDTITRIENKTTNKRAVDAFIGLMYATDSCYLNNLSTVNAKETYQGFDKNLDLKAHTVRDWLDFGTYEKWQELNAVSPEISFPKPDELFYCDNNKIIKYFTKQEHAKLRALRADQNSDCMPSNVIAQGNFLIHDYAPGDIIYNQYNPELFHKMLIWCKQNLWQPAVDQHENFSLCDQFYRKKTFERLEQFRIKYSDWSEPTTVNKQTVQNIEYYLNQIDWQNLSQTRLWAFIHGDLHFDNMVYDSHTDKFTAIDWRTDFAGSLNGDVYYDLAKLLGGLRLNYKSVKNNLLSYTESNDTVEIQIPSVNDLDVYETILKTFVAEQGWDWQKVELLVPIIYLNMSPLHEAPFDKFLISLSQLYFKKYFS